MANVGVFFSTPLPWALSYGGLTGEVEEWIRRWRSEWRVGETWSSQALVKLCSGLCSFELILRGRKEKASANDGPVGTTMWVRYGGTEVRMCLVELVPG